MCCVGGFGGMDGNLFEVVLDLHDGTNLFEHGVGGVVTVDIVMLDHGHHR